MAPASEADRIMGVDHAESVVTDPAGFISYKRCDLALQAPSSTTVADVGGVERYGDEWIEAAETAT